MAELFRQELSRHGEMRTQIDWLFKNTIPQFWHSPRLNRFLEYVSELQKGKEGLAFKNTWPLNPRSSYQVPL